MSSGEPWAGYLDETNRLQFFNSRQRDALGNVTLCTAPLSFVGSLLICYTIIREGGGRGGNDNRTKRDPFERIMLGLSITDVIASASMIWSPWAIPQSVKAYDVSFAKGTFRSCELSGFCLTFWFGTMIYMAGLCLYYVAVICYQKKDDWTQRWIEPWVHTLGFGYPVLFGAFALMTEIFNPIQILPGICTVTVYPFGCTYVEGLECIRGTNVSAIDLSYYANVGMIGLIWVIIVVSMVKIIITVRRTEERMARYAAGVENYRRTQCAFRQAMLYIGACTLTAVPIIVAQSIHTGATSPLANLFITAASKSLSPLQGYLNALIYFNNHRHVFGEGRNLAFLSSTTTMMKLSSTAKQWRSSSIGMNLFVDTAAKGGSTDDAFLDAEVHSNGEVSTSESTVHPVIPLEQSTKA